MNQKEKISKGYYWGLTYGIIRGMRHSVRERMGEYTEKLEGIRQIGAVIATILAAILFVLAVR